MTNEQLRMQLIGGILTEGEYKEKLEENKKSLNENELVKVDNSSLNKREDEKGTLFIDGIVNIDGKDYNFKLERREDGLTFIDIEVNGEYENAIWIVDSLKKLNLLDPDLDFEDDEEIFDAIDHQVFRNKSLNEHYVAGGIVGIQAINTIPPREKSDYETAFEHFLSERYEKEEAKEATLPPSPDENSSIIQLMRNLLASGVAIDGVPTDIENVSDEELYKIAQQYMMKQTHSK